MTTIFFNYIHKNPYVRVSGTIELDYIPRIGETIRIYNLNHFSIDRWYDKEIHFLFSLFVIADIIHSESFFSWPSKKHRRIELVLKLKQVPKESQIKKYKLKEKRK